MFVFMGEPPNTGFLSSLWSVVHLVASDALSEMMVLSPTPHPALANVAGDSSIYARHLMSAWRSVQLIMLLLLLLLFVLLRLLSTMSLPRLGSIQWPCMTIVMAMLGVGCCEADFVYVWLHVSMIPDKI